MSRIRRFVAIGDSATEGLEDPDPHGGYRGWADRLAIILARESDGPVEYANLAIRGQVAAEIRALQFDRALAMKPDLLGVTAGVNDCLGWRVDLASVTEHLVAMYAEAVATGAVVVTFTLPDPHTINPLISGPLRDRVLRLNQIQRREAERYGVVLLDLEAEQVAGDRRLWFDDRLHGNALGHERVAHGVAHLLGLPGHDHWIDPLPTAVEPEPWRDRVAGDLTWARRHLGPWLVRGIRGVREGSGVEPKRPVPTVVEVVDPETDPATHADPATSRPDVPTDPPGPPGTADALVLVDVQRAVLEGSGAVPDADRVTAAIERQLATARTAGAPVVWLQHDGDTGSADEPGTAGWELALEPVAGEPVLRKRHDDGFIGTGLEPWLTRSGATRVSVVGLLSEMCVASTARSALARGFGVVLARDGHATHPVPALPPDTDDVPAAMVARVAEWSLGDAAVVVPTSEAVSFRAPRPA